MSRDIKEENENPVIGSWQSKWTENLICILRLILDNMSLITLDNFFLSSVNNLIVLVDNFMRKCDIFEII